MAESTNRVILKVEFDGNNAVQQTVALRKSFEELTGERQKLLQKVKEGNELSEKELVQLEILNAKLTENKRETREVTKAIDDSLKIRKAEVGSIAANRAELSKLTAEYIKTGKPTEQQTARIKALSDTLKAQEGAIGDNRRNVGGYREALLGLKGPIGSAVNGISAFNTTMRANPIGAVITVLQLLFDALSKNAGIADKISFIFAGVNKAFKFIIDTVKNVVTNFDNLTDAIQNPIKFFYNLGVGIKNSAQAGYEAAQAMDAFTESQAKLNSEIKQNEIQIRALTFQLKDKTKTEKERIAIAETIAAFEIDNSNKQLEKSKQLLEAKKLELKDLELNGEQKAELLELESAVIEAESEKQIAQSQKQTRINILLDKQETESLKEEKEHQVDIIQEANVKILEKQNELDEARKKLAEKQLKEQEEANKRAIDDIIAQVEKEEAEFKKSREKRLEGEKAFAQAELDIQKAKFGSIKALIDIADAAAGDNATLQALLFAFDKAVAIAEIIVNLQRERAAIAATNALLGPAGVPLTIAQNTAAAIRAATGIALVTATAIPQLKKAFYDGGYTGDGSPTDQSTSLGQKPYTYHKGEYVVPNKVLSTPQGAQYVGMLEAMRRSTPGNLAYLGGYADGGFTQRALAQNVNSQIAASELQRAFENMPVPVVRVTEIERVTGNRERAINVSDL